MAEEVFRVVTGRMLDRGITYSQAFASSKELDEIVHKALREKDMREVIIARA